MGEELDLVYLLEKAAIINEKIFRNRILKNENHDITIELRQWRAASEGVEHLSIQFYRKRFEYTVENMLEQFLTLKKDFVTRFKGLSEKEQKIHLMSLLNDVVALIKAKRLDITECLPLYKLGLKTKILLSRGVLGFSRYCAIITVSNTKKDFQR